MKKTLFAAMTAIVMTFAFTACGPKTPEEKAIAGMEEMLRFCKEYTVNSAEDALMFDTKFEEFVNEIEGKYGNIDGDELDFSEEQQKYLEKLEMDIITEVARITDEADDAGYDVDTDDDDDFDLDDLDLDGDDDDDDFDLSDLF